MIAPGSDAPLISDAGDSALLLSLGEVIDPGVNGRAIAIAAAVLREAIPGVRDVVPTFRSVALFFDPLATDVAAARAALERASAERGVIAERPVIEVPVSYGGEDGPDLGDVAAFAGCTPQDVIDRHASDTYRVFMLGFLPGFAYMGTVDPAIAAPRRDSPRLRVPAGAVGIAGRQTGIYPRESPGGWQLIGRTAVSVFEPARTPAALFAPGDRVRFVPVPADVVSGFSRTADQVRLKADTTRDGAGPHITVLRPGLLTTIQDEGRWGHQGSGVAVSGPMDAFAHRLANALVGNPRDAATLEATLMGPELRIEQPTVVAVTGGDLGVTLEKTDLPRNTAVHCEAGSVIRFGARRSGARAYVAFAGGIEVPGVLGSRATHVLSGLGGVEGRAVRAGDRLPLGEPASAPVRRPAPRSAASGIARLRVLPGPQDRYFPAGGLESIQRTRFTISAQSDRMGYRLVPESPIPLHATGDMISDVTFPGGLQIPPSGHPILLMADRQTTGGYPQIATVISADLPAAGQLAPGDSVEFQVCTRAESVAALIAREGKLLAIG